MSARIKLPAPENVSISARQTETRDFGAAMDYVSRCLISKIRISDPETVAVVSETGLNGSDLIQVLSSGESRIYNNPASANVALSAAGLGGLVSGITLVDGDYLYWAFLDPSKPEPFQGFGATKRPVESVTGFSVGTGVKGTETTFDVVANGFTFSIGSRVIIHQGDGTDWSTDWNQGVVTATTATTVTVDLDNESYGNNLANAAALLTQTDGYQPLDSADGTLYGGYRYAYLGHAQRFDNAITYTRQRGEWYTRPIDVLFRADTFAGSDNPYIIDTGQFTGADTREIQVTAQARYTAVRVAWNYYLGARVAAPGNAPHLILSNDDIAGQNPRQWEVTSLRVPCRADGTGVTGWYDSVRPGEAQVFLHGWHETRF